MIELLDNVLFTLIGFAGLYFVLGIRFLLLIGREIAHRPQAIDDANELEVPHGDGMVRDPVIPDDGVLSVGRL